MRKIAKVFTPQDAGLNRQIDEIIAGQLLNLPEYTVTFTTSALTQKVDIGSFCNRFIIIDNNANITVKRVSSDNRYMHLTASAAGTILILVYKGGN